MKEFLKHTPTHADCSMTNHHAQLGKKAAELYAVVAGFSPDKQEEVLRAMLSDLQHFAVASNIDWSKLLKDAKKDHKDDVEQEKEFRRGANAMRMNG